MMGIRKRHEESKPKTTFSGNMNYLLRLLHLFTIVYSVRGKEFKNNITSPIVDILHSQLPEFYTLSVTGGRYQRYYTPHFGSRVNNITSYIGDTATLYCSIINLGTKTVVWRKTSSRHPITVGTFTFISDKSYSIQRQIEKNEWNLVIKNVQPKHAGLYECHISSKEKQKFNVYLNVIGRKGGGGGGSDGATTNNIRRGIAEDDGPRNEKNHQKTSSSERSTTISRKWWIVFGFMSLLYQNGVTFLEP